MFGAMGCSSMECSARDRETGWLARNGMLDA
jgi:hypothetical protein